MMNAAPSQAPAWHRALAWLAARTTSLGMSAQLALGPLLLDGRWRRAGSQARLAPGLIVAAAALRGSSTSVSATWPG